MVNVKLPWWIPQERIVHETEEEINSAIPSYILKSEKLEYRDLATRTWWQYFDEFEFRKSVPRWAWFGEGYTDKERRLVFKLDLIIVLYAVMGYWCKFFDSANLTNAYVSGMKEDLNMKGNDFVNTQVMTSIGNCIFMIPIIYLLPRFPATYLCFINEFMWSLLTLVTYKAQSVPSLKAIRFFLGGFETAYFPIIHYTLSNFYKPSEISSRASIFYCGQFLGILTSGLLQGAIYRNLNGVNGIAGWRWMFIIDGVISFAVCFIGLFFIPGTPFKCYSIWLTEDEIKLARKRMRENGTDDGLNLKKFLDWNTWKTLVTSWHFWILGLAGIGGFNANAAIGGQFALWLQSLKEYSIPKINNLTAIPPALGIAYVIFACFMADITQKRFGMIVVVQILNMIGISILAVWYVPKSAKWFAYYFGYWAWAQSSIFYPVLNDILRHDANLKAIAWNINYLIGLQSYTWITVLAWKTENAPRFRTGFITANSMAALEAVCAIIAFFFFKRDEKNRAASQGIILYDSRKGELPPSEEGSTYDERISDEKNPNREVVYGNVESD